MEFAILYLFYTIFKMYLNYKIMRSVKQSLKLKLIEEDFELRETETEDVQNCEAEGSVHISICETMRH